MAVILEFLNFIVPIEVIKAKYPGGWDQCLEDHSNLIGGRVWHDDYLFRDGAMNGSGIEELLDDWTDMGFIPTKIINGETVWNDLCVIDELNGVSRYTCDWLTYESIMRAAYLNGTDPDNLIRQIRPEEVYIPNPNEKRRVNYLDPAWKNEKVENNL